MTSDLVVSSCVKLKGLPRDFPGGPVVKNPPARHVNWYSHYGEQYGDSLKKKKLGINLPYDHVIPLLGIYPEETLTEKDTCTPVFIAALFTIARTWKQPRCPLTDDWIKKLWYIYRMEYYSAIKRDTFESVLMRWMNWNLLYRVKWERERWISYFNVYMESRKMVLKNLFTGQQWRKRHRE